MEALGNQNCLLGRGGGYEWYSGVFNNASFKSIKDYDFLRF